MHADFVMVKNRFVSIHNHYSIDILQSCVCINSMDRAVQTLLAPLGVKTLADVAIVMPEGIAETLRGIFSFDVGGRNELEGDKIYKALQRFARYRQDETLCQVRFVTRNELGDEADTVYALTPIEHAAETIEFIEDQISAQPEIETVNYLGMAKVLSGGEREEYQKDVVGWFDLETPCFIVKDLKLLAALRRNFALHELNLPTMDRI